MLSDLRLHVLRVFLRKAGLAPLAPDAAGFQPADHPGEDAVLPYELLRSSLEEAFYAGNDNEYDKDGNGNEGYREDKHVANIAILSHRKQCPDSESPAGAKGIQCLAVKPINSQYNYSDQ